MTENMDSLSRELQDFARKNVIVIQMNNQESCIVNFDQVFNLSLLFSISARMTFYPLYTNIVKCLYSLEEVSHLIIQDEVMEREDHNIKNLMELFSTYENIDLPEKIQSLILDNQTEYQPSRSFDDYPKSVDHDSVNQSFFDNMIMNNVVRDKMTATQFDIMNVSYTTMSNKSYLANEARKFNDIDNKSRLKHWMFENKKNVDIELVSGVFGPEMWDDRYASLQSLLGPTYSEKIIREISMLYDDFHAVLRNMRFHAERDNIEDFRKEVWYAATKFHNLSGRLAK